MKDTALPSEEQIDKLIESLLPPNEEMDRESASIILEQAGVDRDRLASALKARLQQRVEEMRARGEIIPANLLKVIATL